MIARLAVLGVAIVCWSGLVIQWDASLGLAGGDAGRAVWAMLRYFTVTTNLAVAAVFTMLAAGRTVRPALLGGVTLAIALVGVVYGLLLRGLLELSGGALLADTLLHKVVPALVPLWWLAFAPKGGLGWRAPWVWALYPALYLPYALIRGAFEGRYAYPFINVDRLGWGGVAINAIAIAIGFVAAGHALVAIDRRMERR